MTTQYPRLPHPSSTRSESRYPQRRRVRRDSSLEIMRRTMARIFRQELNPGHRR